jgi:hypothetical protein
VFLFPSEIFHFFISFGGLFGIDKPRVKEHFFFGQEVQEDLSGERE